MSTVKRFFAWIGALFGLAFAAILLATPVTASADDMDIALSRLTIEAQDPAVAPDTSCSTATAVGTPRSFCPDNEAWRRLMSQFGMGMAPPVLSPARTLGYGGFYLGLEGWITGVDSGQDYWRRGTEGDAGARTEHINRFPASTLIWSRVDIRKGFPFGFELGTSFSHVLNTDLYAWGLEIKWSVFEGYRQGLGGFFPDVAVRGMVNTMTGDSEFNLTVPTFDIIASKPIPISGVGTLTPFVSWQMAWILADSELVDLTPGIDSFDECRPDPVAPSGVMGDTSSVDCMRTEPLPSGRVVGEDYNNNGVFEQIRAARMRLALGVQGRYQAITLSGSFMFDLSKPGEMDAEMPADLPRQWTAAAGVGVSF